MNQSRITLTDDVRNLYHQVIGAILTILQHGFKEFKKDGDKYRAPSGYDLTLEVKTVETKKGDFGGDKKEDYDVKEYRIVDHNHQEKTFNYHGLLTSQTDEKGNKTSFDYNENYQLVKITSPTGLVYSITYNTDGYIGAIQIPNGSTLTYDKAHRLTELRQVDKQDKLISSYGYEYDDGGYIAKETIKQDGETLVHTYTYDTLGQVGNMTVSDGAGKELSKLSYTYDLAGNKLTSTETVDGKESQTLFTYDDHNRLTKLEGPDSTTTYTYDKNGNRIASEKNSENRLLAIKDKKGLLMAALYDGDDNCVFTASRKEGKNTYQLFQRKPKESKSGRKSPYTAPSGEENSLFWYGFSQNVLQALSTLPQTIGSIWHSIFDDVSRAYHQKVAKDRATKEGIVVNPPELGNLPGQGEVTYASQVQDVLIPYTTREDTYNYYEERNYVNDVNREHTEVLETYDHDGKARETYSYGKARASYLNNQTGDSYNYLTNQSGSVTGLTKDGQAVASSNYNLYGARKTSTDTTGNPFAYNGEARDDTGLDYLRARYYDSQGGTFLTEDSYPGEETDPLSQNLYSYVQNNPVNYTDPSGHFWNSIKKGWNYVKKTASNAWNGVKRVASNTWNTVKRVASNTWNGVKSFASKAWNVTKSAFNHATNWVSTQVNRAVNWGSRQWNKVQTAYNSAGDYVQTKYHQAAAQIEARRQQVVRSAYALATGLSSSPTIRESKNLLRNWGTALQNTLKHVCTTAERVKNQVVDFVKNVDWKKVAVTAAAIGVGIALTVATGGLGAPVAMAIGGAASGAIISGYDAYSSGQRGWELVGSIAKGAGTGAISGLIGGQLMGAGASLATNVTQSISNQAVRQVAKIGVESAVETAIDTGIDLATGNKITGQTVAMNFAFNTFTNGAGSVSPKKAPKADIVTTKPTGGRLPMTVDNLQMFAKKPKARPDFYVDSQGNTVPSQTNISDEMAQKILYGKQKSSNSNKVIGGHSPNINNSNSNYATQTIRTHSDGTQSVDFVKQLDNGKVSQIKNSTLFPQNWSDKNIIDSIKNVGESVPLGVRASDGASFHRGKINGVEIDVIKLGNDVISAYSIGNNNSYPGGFQYGLL